MEDLGSAGPGVHMLGGGNPARIPRWKPSIDGDSPRLRRRASSDASSRRNPHRAATFVRATVAGFLADATAGHSRAQRRADERQPVRLLHLLTARGRVRGPPATRLLPSHRVHRYADWASRTHARRAVRGDRGAADGFFKYTCDSTDSKPSPTCGDLRVRPTNLPATCCHSTSCSVSTRSPASAACR